MDGSISFAYPYLLSLLLLVVLAYWFRPKTSVPFSSLRLVKRTRGVGRYLVRGAQAFMALAIAAAVLALARPQLEGAVEYSHITARDIIILFDASGSMNGEFKDPDFVPYAGSIDERITIEDEKKKIGVAKITATNFIKQRKDDRIGAFAFGRGVYLLYPVTNSHTPLVKSILAVKAEGIASYATHIYSALKRGIQHFEEMGSEAGKALVIVSDGINSGEKFDPAEIEELVRELKEKGITLYWIAVVSSTNDGPITKRSLDIVVEASGGKRIEAWKYGAMRDAFNQIDKLEKGTIEVKQSAPKKDIYHLFIAAASGLFLLGFIPRKLWEV